MGSGIPAGMIMNNLSFSERWFEGLSLHSSLVRFVQNHEEEISKNCRTLSKFEVFYLWHGRGSWFEDWHWNFNVSVFHVFQGFVKINFLWPYFLLLDPLVRFDLISAMRFEILLWITGFNQLKIQWKSSGREETGHCVERFSTSRFEKLEEDLLFLSKKHAQ